MRFPFGVHGEVTCSVWVQFSEISEDLVYCATVGVRTEVSSREVEVAGFSHLGIRFSCLNVNPGVSLIVFACGIVFRLVFFYEVGLEYERLDIVFGLNDGDISNFGQHLLYPWSVMQFVLEVASYSGPEVDCFSDIEN